MDLLLAQGQGRNSSEDDGEKDDEQDQNKAPLNALQLATSMDHLQSFE